MKQTKFIVILKHSNDSDGIFKTFTSHEEAIDEVHNFFLSYGFELREGKPFDSGNDDKSDGGYKVFSNVTIVNGKVASFVHCDGEGPSGDIF